MLYTGIDLHRRVIALCTVNESGTVLARSRIKTDPEAILSYFHQWSEPHRAVVECTTGWYWFCGLLHTAGIDIILAHAKYLKAISYAKVKTDAVDAHTLAQLLRMDFIPEAHQLPMEYRSLRDLLRQRLVMQQTRITLIRRISSILAQFNITPVPVSPSSSKFAQFLAECTLPDEYRTTLSLYHQQCLQTTNNRIELERYFKARLEPTQTLQLLKTIPGIGDISGSIIAMETGDIHRFASDKHYFSYCRLVPGAKDSGGKYSHRSGSKDGNQYLKYAFHEAGIKAIQFYPEIREFAERLEKRSNKTIAHTVVAKEVAKCAYYVLTRQQEFKTFKGIEITKLRDWPRARPALRDAVQRHKPVRLTGSST